MDHTVWRYAIYFSRSALSSEEVKEVVFAFDCELFDNRFSDLSFLPFPSKEYEYEYDKGHRLPMSEEPIEPRGNDVLMGRGGKNNQWCGNEKFRTMARTQAENYRMSSKKGKSYISRELVRRVRELDPPGRFLKKDTKGGWEDVGDEVAREKASQVLRDAVAVGMNADNDVSEDYVEKGIESSSTKHQRSVSAPPVMASNRTRRHRDWEVQPPTPTRSMSSVPHYQQPLYHSPKRPRYYDYAWVAYEQQENHPPRHPRMYDEYVRYNSYPMQHAIYRPEHPSTPQTASTEPVDDFDLFNGELLRSDTESPDLDTRKSF